MILSKGLNKLTLLVGGAMVLTALVAGGMIGGLGPSVPRADEITWSSPTSTATATAPATSQPTARPSATPTVKPSLTPRPTQTSAPATPTSPAPSNEPEPTAAVLAVIEYTVQNGDVLFGLAQRFNTTNAEIIALNPGINPESLVVGSVLRIPNVGATAPQP